MYEKDGKKYPFKIDEYYSVGLNSLKRVYTRHPKFNGNVRLIYELLLDHWNAEYGYAFPDQWELARESGQSLSSVRRNLKTLKELDLIDIKKSPIGRKNNVYYLKKPVTTPEELYRKFPDAEKHYKEHTEKIDKDKELSVKKWDEDEEKRELYTQKTFSTVIYPKNDREGVNDTEEIDELSRWF